MFSKTPLDCRYQKIPVKTLEKRNWRKMLPKTPLSLCYQNNCIDRFVIMVPHNSVTKNTARTSTPERERIEKIFRKIISKIGAQNTFKKSLSKHDGIERLVNNKYDNGSQNTVKKPHSKKDSI